MTKPLQFLEQNKLGYQSAASMLYCIFKASVTFYSFSGVSLGILKDCLKLSLTATIKINGTKFKSTMPGAVDEQLYSIQIYYPDGWRICSSFSYENV